MIVGWAPLDAVASAGPERARWLGRIARGQVPGRLDPRSGAVVVWAPLTAERLDALVRAGLHRRLPALVEVRAALPELCRRLAAAGGRPRRRGLRVVFPGAESARRAA